MNCSDYEINKGKDYSFTLLVKVQLGGLVLGSFDKEEMRREIEIHIETMNATPFISSATVILFLQ